MQKMPHSSVAQSNTFKQFDCCSRCNFECKNTLFLVQISVQMHSFAHLAVDDGEQKPVLEYKEAPILIPDGHVDPNRIRHLFEGSCENLPAEVATLVLRKLVQYPDT